MERLTQPGHKFNLLNIMQGLTKYTEVDEILTRLAAYEDTGLTPDEATALTKAQQDGRLVVLPCEVERLKEIVQKLHDSYGCLYGDIDLPYDYGDCSKGCWQCIVDGLHKETDTALKSPTPPQMM